LIDSGVTVSFRNLIFDGSGQAVWNAIRNHGTLDIQNCDFTEIKCQASGSPYNGAGVATFEASGPLTITNSNFSEIGRIGVHIFGETTLDGCTYTGKGVGDWLDYFACVGSFDGSVGDATIRNCMVSGNRGVASDGSTSAGMLVTTFFGPDTEALIENSTFTDNTTGIAVGYDETDASTVSANYNSIFGNDFGIVNTSDTAVVDAENNYWGDATGPEDLIGSEEADNPPCFDPLTMSNTDGLGNGVSDELVDYCPWLETPATLSLVAADDCINEDEGDTFCVSIEVSNLVEGIVGGQYFLEYDTAVLDFIAIDAGDELSGPCEPTSVDSPFSINVFSSIDEGAGTIDFASGLPFGDPPVSGDAVMARIEFEILTAVEVCDVSELVSFRTDADPPTRVTDEFAQPVLPLGLEDMGPVTVDDTAPMISTPVVSDELVDGVCEATVTFSATVTDNCCVDVSGVVVDVTLPTGNAILGTPNITLMQVSPTEVSVTGDVTVSDLTGCPAIVEVTVNADDCCGNSADEVSDTGDVNDISPPVVTCPDAPAAVNAEAGTCEAIVMYDPASAEDNCDPAPSTPICTPPSKSSFMDGTTVVTCSSTDDCGNEGTCMFDVVVNPFNTIEVTVELNGAPNNFSRCITFTAHNCVTDDEYVVNQVLSFTGGIATDTIEVPCDVVWHCLTAKDLLHTLASNVTLGTSGTNYTAEFTAAEDADLLCGDATNDNLVDVLDFGALFGQFLMPTDANTDCSDVPPPPFHTDFTGDGVIDTPDFICLQDNFLEVGDDTDDCSPPSVLGGNNNLPLPNIGVDRLARQVGRNAALAADVDRNGVVDVRDLNRFAEKNGLFVPERLYQLEEQVQAPGNGNAAQTGGRR
jgi:hypothetical protein